MRGIKSTCTFVTSIVKNPRGTLNGLSIINDPQIDHSKSNSTTPIKFHLHPKKETKSWPFLHPKKPTKSRPVLHLHKIMFWWRLVIWILNYWLFSIHFLFSWWNSCKWIKSFHAPNLISWTHNHPFIWISVQKFEL